MSPLDQPIAQEPTAPLSLDEREPLVVRAAVTTAVTAVVHVAVVLGLPIPGEAELAIGGAVDALGLVVLLLLVRPKVTPAAKVLTRVNTAGEVVTGEAAAVPVGTVLDPGVNPPVEPGLVVDPEHAETNGDLEPPPFD
jgi:hypothetical protein